MVNCKREITWAVLVLSFAGLACAQENLDSGKTGAQLYASNCAICHKTPQSLGRGGMFGLSGFLREHYTASRETAAAIAAYIESTGRAALPGKRIGPAARTARGGDKTKKPGVKTNESQATTVEAKPADAKPADAKPSEAKASEPKTETTPAAKPDEPKKPD